MLLNASKNIGLEVNTGKTEYIEIGRHQAMIANNHKPYSEMVSYKELLLFHNKIVW